MTKVVCGGLITVDLLFDVPGHPDLGQKARAQSSRIEPGGGALIAASAIAALGGRAALVGAVGDDSLGDLVRSSLAARGIDAGLVQSMRGLATARSAVLIAPDGDRTIINHRDDALFSAHVTLPTPMGFDAVLVDTRWPAGAAALLRAAKAAGKPAVLDAEAPVQLAAEALCHASHVVFSEQGLCDYTGTCDAPALASAAARLGCFVAVTRGARPVLCHGPEGAFAVDAFAVRAVDTLGAGDVWHAAFTLALGQGQAITAAVRYANAAAALKVARRGHFPTAAEVDALRALGGDPTDAGVIG